MSLIPSIDPQELLEAALKAIVNLAISTFGKDKTQAILAAEYAAVDEAVDDAEETKLDDVESAG